MNNLSDLSILFHAWGLESSYNNTKLCRIVKAYSENCYTKEELVEKLNLPSSIFLKQAEEEILEASELGLSCISILDSSYPSCLTEIDDPPMILFVMGGVENLPFNAVERSYAIVGARKPSIYGESIAKALGRGLSNLGITVVSGLASGIDRRAHEGSLKGSADIPTIAVLGSGLFEIYPHSNQNLAEEILSKGGILVSEYGLKRLSRPDLFPRRNRIISALSSSVIVVEAEERSGSLITARLAAEQNRDVCAVPGPIDSSLSRGTNKLISQGASIIVSVEDFLNDVKDREFQGKSKDKSLVDEIKMESTLSDNERKVLEVVSGEILTIEQILYQSKLPQAELRLAITNLLLRDFLIERDGVYFREED